MSWVEVPESYNLKPGDRVRFTYEIDVPWWLEWTPDKVMDYLVSGVAGSIAQVKATVTQHLNYESHEFEVVKSGDRYRLHLIFASKGTPLALLLPYVPYILSIIVAAIYLLIVYYVSVTVWKVVEAVPGIGMIVLVLLAYLILKEVKR